MEITISNQQPEEKNEVTVRLTESVYDFFIKEFEGIKQKFTYGLMSEALKTAIKIAVDSLHYTMCQKCRSYEYFVSEINIKFGQDTKMSFIGKNDKQVVFEIIPDKGEENV